MTTLCATPTLIFHQKIGYDKAFKISNNELPSGFNRRAMSEIGLATYAALIQIRASTSAPLHGYGIYSQKMVHMDTFLLIFQKESNNAHQV